jgi:hypothetical protein
MKHKRVIEIYKVVRAGTDKVTLLLSMVEKISLPEKKETRIWFNSTQIKAKYLYRDSMFVKLVNAKTVDGIDKKIAVNICNTCSGPETF